MNSFQFSIAQSAWWLPVIFAVSFGLAWILYAGKNNWSSKMRILLGSLRFLAVFLVLFLLLEPALTSIHSYKEKPVFPVIIDNSGSVVLGGTNEKELKEGLKQIVSMLENAGFDPLLYVFGKTVPHPDSIRFNYKSSDIAGLISAADASVSDKKEVTSLLISDGIFNSGASPVYKDFRTRIISLGIGDTVPGKDLALQSVQNNSIAYLGNKFTIRAEMQAVGFAGKTMEISLANSNGVIEKKTLDIKKDFYIESTEFIVPAEKKGFQRYTIALKTLNGEVNLLNNIKYTYVDVVDDRENILIVSQAPHPVIKAIKAALLKEENKTVDLLIPGINRPEPKNYDLVILVNCLKNTVTEATAFIKEETPLFYVAGTGTDYPRFNAENGLVEVISQNQTDQVQGAFNEGFTRFKLPEETDKTLSRLPPLDVSFGEVKIKGGSDVLIYQKINGIQTSKPLLLFGGLRKKTGVLLTDGLWLWRMYESQETGSAEKTDALLSKTVQYLAAKEDKRKFRIYPHQKEYSEGDPVLIETELFNDIFERVTNARFSFSFSNEGKKLKNMDFQSAEGNTALYLTGLGPGVYKTEAFTTVAGKKLAASTEFVIKERQLESVNLQADHALLRELSARNRGNFYTWTQRNKAMEELGRLKPKAIWKSNEKTKELIDEVWYFLLIIATLTTEWVIRKYTGGY